VTESFLEKLQMKEIDPQDRPIYGARAIGEALGLSEGRAYYALENGHLDGVVSRLGGRWCSTPRRLRRIANGEAKAETTSTKSDNAAA
jgi:hypothetical protein